MDIKFEDYYLIRQTLVDMLYDRSEQPVNRFHFERGSLDIIKMIPRDVLERLFESALSSSAYINLLDMELRNDSQRVIVKFLKDGMKLNKNINSTREYYSMKSSDILIVVLCNNNKPLDEYLQTTIKNTEIFWYKSLTFNVSRHSLVPKHELVDPFKKDELKKIYYLNSFDQLPTILISDPVSKYYGMRSGDICKITRNIRDVGESVNFRLVSDKN